MRKPHSNAVFSLKQFIAPYFLCSCYERINLQFPWDVPKRRVLRWRVDATNSDRRNVWGQQHGGALRSLLHGCFASFSLRHIASLPPPPPSLHHVCLPMSPAPSPVYMLLPLLRIQTFRTLLASQLHSYPPRRLRCTLLPFVPPDSTQSVKVSIKSNVC